MEYLEYRQPLLDACATVDSRGIWRSPDGKWHRTAQNCAEHMGVEPIRSDTAPKTRNFAAIRKATMAETSRRTGRRMVDGRLGAAVRAFQYAMARHGIDTPHSINLPDNLERACHWERATDNSLRVRAIRTDVGVVEIPHWDFVPEIAEA